MWDTGLGWVPARKPVCAQALPSGSQRTVCWRQRKKMGTVVEGRGAARKEASPIWEDVRKKWHLSMNLVKSLDLTTTNRKSRGRCCRRSNCGTYKTSNLVSSLLYCAGKQKQQGEPVDKKRVSRQDSSL